MINNNNNFLYNNILSHSKKIYYDIIFDLKNVGKIYIEKVDENFNIEGFLFQFDVLLQAILLKISFADRNIHYNEIRLINDLVEYGDLFIYFDIKNVKSSNKTFFDMISNLVGSHGVQYLKSLEEMIDNNLRLICSNFSEPFACIDYYSEYDNSYEFLNDIKKIAQKFFLVDYNVNEIENKTFENNYKKLFLDYYVDNIKKIISENAIEFNKKTNYQKISLNINNLKKLNYLNSSEYTQGIVVIDATYFSGTGFLISQDGYLITCYHVIKDCLENDRIIKVHCCSNCYDAITINYDEKLDLALLKIDCNKEYLEINEKDEQINNNEPIITIGYTKNAHHGYSLSRCFGKVLEISEIDNLKIIYCNFDSDYGFSGSPVISQNTGKVIGILQGMTTAYNEICGQKYEEIDYFQSIEYIWKRFLIN